MLKSPPDTQIIEAGRSRARIWSDLWRYRELLFFLSWRDILVRYKQTVLGILWSVLRPLLTMLIFTVLFGRLARLPSDNVPYPLLVLAAMVPWQFFAGSISEAGNSLIGNANLIAKVFFPRLVIPMATTLVTLVDAGISFLLLLGLMISYGTLPDWRILFLPFVVLPAYLLALGCGLWFSALNIRYRDFRHLIPFLVQVGLYVSPVGYASTIIPGKWRLIYALNPMVGIIDSFRWILLHGRTQLYMPGLAVSAALIALIFISGLLYFRRVERTFADII